MAKGGSYGVGDGAKGFRDGDFHYVDSCEMVDGDGIHVQKRGLLAEAYNNEKEINMVYGQQAVDSDSDDDIPILVRMGKMNINKNKK